MAIGIAGCPQQLIAKVRFLQPEKVAIERPALFEIRYGDSDFKSIQDFTARSRSDDKLVPLTVRILNQRGSCSGAVPALKPRRRIAVLFESRGERRLIGIEKRQQANSNRLLHRR